MHVCIQSSCFTFMFCFRRASLLVVCIEVILQGIIFKVFSLHLHLPHTNIYMYESCFPSTSGSCSRRANNGMRAHIILARAFITKQYDVVVLAALCGFVFASPPLFTCSCVLLRGRERPRSTSGQPMKALIFFCGQAQGLPCRSVDCLFFTTLCIPVSPALCTSGCNYFVLAFEYFVYLQIVCTTHCA